MEIKYPQLFDISAEQPAIPAIEGLARGLRQFFAERDGTMYQLKDLGPTIPGRYRMFRPHWRSRAPGWIMTSVVDITNKPYGLDITETQDFDEPEQWQQRDEGAIFSCGKYIYFLTKEAGHTVDISTVKFGIIDKHLNYKGVTQNFYGVMFVSSNWHIYPMARYYCLRIDPDEELKSTVMRIR